VEVFCLPSEDMDRRQDSGFRIQELKEVTKLPTMSLSENLSVGHNQRLKNKSDQKGNTRRKQTGKAALEWSGANG
jgi:hypothetical protein